MDVIEIIKLTKRFGDTIAVDALSLNIPKGEFFAFIGPNGAGKTTTLKVVAGLMRPTSGSVMVGGFDIAKKPLDAKRMVSFVPDVPYVYEKLTGREFLYFIGEIYSMARDWYRREVERLLTLFEMREYGDLLMEQYSHGMKQKVVICSALLHNPSLIIIDEPMVGLDPRSARLVKDLLKEQTRKGVTVFMTTHTLSLAEEVADRIGIINKGRLIGLGRVEEIKRDAPRLEDVFLKMTCEE